MSYAITKIRPLINKLEEEIDEILDFVNDNYVNSDENFDDITIFKINENNHLQDEIFVA